jgi:bifunctional enzyme CysN/CysC
MRDPTTTSRADSVSNLGAGSGPLRFLTCGSIAAGKTTLVERLLHDLNVIPADPPPSLEGEAKARGAEAGLADLLRGLKAEDARTFGIDIAYRHFHTPARGFIFADSPDGEHYTRDLMAGALRSDLAVLLVDARSGLQEQTLHHSLIVSLFGIRHLVLAVNKMDLAGYSEEVFRRIERDYRDFTKELGFHSVAALPASAHLGGNVVHRDAAMDWYGGPTLLERLETTPVSEDRAASPFRLPIQRVSRQNFGFDGFGGTIRGGGVKLGDTVAIAGAPTEMKVTRIVSSTGEHGSAKTGDTVMLAFDREVEASPGDMICQPDNQPAAVDQFAANILWLGNAPMISGRSYLLKAGARKLPAEITSLRYRVDIRTGAHIAAKTLGLNEIGFCNLALDAPAAVDAFADNRDTGSFILIDRTTGETVGAGIITFALRRASNIHHQKLAVDRNARSIIKGHKPAILWFTGLSGSGKSTVASLLEQKLNLMGCHSYLIDGDNVRGGLNRDLGFTETDRVENVRRVQEVARLFLDAGLIVLVSLISPYRQDREQLREKVVAGEFVEVFVDAPIEVCRQRDPKGLYAKAARGELRNFTGVDAPYEVPENPELHLNTVAGNPEQLVGQILDYLRKSGVLGSV